jgi:hypothetical protein
LKIESIELVGEAKHRLKKEKEKQKLEGEIRAEIEHRLEEDKINVDIKRREYLDSKDQSPSARVWDNLIKLLGGAFLLGVSILFVMSGPLGVLVPIIAAYWVWNESKEEKKGKAILAARKFPYANQSNIEKLVRVNPNFQLKMPVSDHLTAKQVKNLRNRLKAVDSVSEPESFSSAAAQASSELHNKDESVGGINHPEQHHITLNDYFIAQEAGGTSMSWEEYLEKYESEDEKKNREVRFSEWKLNCLKDGNIAKGWNERDLFDHMEREQAMERQTDSLIDDFIYSEEEKKSGERPEKLKDVRSPIIAEVMADNPDLTEEQVIRMMEEIGF